MESGEFLKKYTNDFKVCLDTIEASGKLMGGKTEFADGIEAAVQLVLTAQRGGKKIIFIGNGGSSAISSHMSTDFWKNGKVRAITFSDPSLLTCLANDLGYDHAFANSIRMFADEGDVVFAISSSGNSKNILNGAEAGRERKCSVVTYSGFGSDNQLRSKGDLNFFVPGYSYGFVETLHLFVIHLILDNKLFLHDKVDVFNKNNPIG